MLVGYLAFYECLKVRVELDNRVSDRWSVLLAVGGKEDSGRWSSLRSWSFDVTTSFFKLAERSGDHKSDGAMSISRQCLSMRRIIVRWRCFSVLIERIVVCYYSLRSIICMFSRC